MLNALMRLQSLTAGDVMARNVHSISASQTMEEAAEYFATREISAAPVVDEAGICVGMLSATDFLRRDFERRKASQEGESIVCSQLQENDDDGPVTVACWSEDRVQRYMAKYVQSVKIGTPLLASVEMMESVHIHRLPVLDDSGRPIGMVSTMDVLSALRNCIDEMRISG